MAHPKQTYIIMLQATYGIASKQSDLPSRYSLYIYIVNFDSYMYIWYTYIASVEKLEWINLLTLKIKTIKIASNEVNIDWAPKRLKQ